MKSKCILAGGRWLLSSGILEGSGGVARFYRADLQKNAPVSTEISGYAISALLFLHHESGGPEFLEEARRIGMFLTRRAWNRELNAMAFEFPPGGEGVQDRTFFFDCGIIVRGLVGLWRETLDETFLERAVDCAESMLRDFDRGTDFDPILELPGKQPLARDHRWSRSPGCYQLKAALGWHELATITGENRFESAYQRVLADSLQNAAHFLPGEGDPDRVMDRLHAFCYFLEGLTPNVHEPRCANALLEGIGRVAKLLYQRPENGLLRSDVIAQLLRLRLISAVSGIAPIDDSAASEAEMLAGFQADDPDPRIDGGFYFGSKDGVMLPYVNPVSTAFGVHALSLWQSYRGGTLQMRPDNLF